MPSRDLQDVADFEFKKTPFSASFWVLSIEGRLVHDCPLLDVPGVGLEIWSLDIMHGWHLGPMQQLVSLSLNYCLATSLWAPPTPLDAEEKRRLGLLAIKAELHQWYKLQRLDPEWKAKGSEATRLDIFILYSLKGCLLLRGLGPHLVDDWAKFEPFVECKSC